MAKKASTPAAKKRPPADATGYVPLAKLLGLVAQTGMKVNAVDLPGGSQ